MSFVDFAGGEGEIDAVDGDQAGETLGDSLCSENRLLLCIHDRLPWAQAQPPAEIIPSGSCADGRSILVSLCFP